MSTPVRSSLGETREKSSPTKRLPKVAFIHVFIPDYHAWCYTDLDRRFPNNFFMLHGPERRGTRPRDCGRLPIENDVLCKNKFFVFKGVELTWIPSLRWLIRNRPDVVVLQDGVRIVSNYFLHLIGKVIGTKIVYYTHGHNHQADFSRGPAVQSVSERLRRFLFAHSDALVVYTPANKSYLESRGVTTKIVVSNNTLDTPTLFNRHSSISKETIEKLRRSIGAQKNHKIIAFLGRLIPEKEVGMFIDVIRQLNRSSTPHYLGLVIGDGPSESELKEYSDGLPVRFVGHCDGRALCEYLASVDCVFLPSHVGLAVIEVFCAGKPFVTCKDRHHSPEVDYIEHNVNGLIIDSSDPAEIASEIARMLDDEERLARMSNEATKTARALHPDAHTDAFERAIRYVTDTE